MRRGDVVGVLIGIIMSTEDPGAVAVTNVAVRGRRIIVDTILVSRRILMCRVYVRERRRRIVVTRSIAVGYIDVAKRTVIGVENIVV